LTFEGLCAEALLDPLPGTPVIRINQARPSAPIEPRRLDENGIVVATGARDRLLMQREPAVATLIAETAIGPDELVHPYLAVVASVFSWWAGGVSFHAGAFVLDGRAWALLGDRQGGKSTTLAWFHRMGIDVVADDLVVVDEGRALIGPRCIDIRPQTATFLGDDVESVRGGDRYRLRLPPMVANPWLAGWVVAREGTSESIKPVPPRDRLGLLTANLSVRRPPVGPGQLLDLASLPMWQWNRPLQLTSLRTSAATLVDTLRFA